MHLKLMASETPLEKQSYETMYDRFETLLAILKNGGEGGGEEKEETRLSSKPLTLNEIIGYVKEGNALQLAMKQALSEARSTIETSFLELKK